MLLKRPLFFFLTLFLSLFYCIPKIEKKQFRSQRFYYVTSFTRITTLILLKYFYYATLLNVTYGNFACLGFLEPLYSYCLIALLYEDVFLVSPKLDR